MKLSGAWKCRQWDAKVFFLQYMEVKFRPSIGNELKCCTAPCRQQNQTQNLYFRPWCMINKMFL